MSDQGTEFTGDVIAVMCKLLGIEKIRTTPYHPQTNGSAERVHQTLQRKNAGSGPSTSDPC